MQPTLAQISRRQLESKLDTLMAEDSYWKSSHPDHGRVRRIAGESLDSHWTSGLRS